MRDVKFLLINPESPFLLDDNAVPPLGILTVAAILLQKFPRDEIKVIHGKVKENELKSAEWVLISATTPQMRAAYSILQRCKNRSKVIIGGPHSTLEPKATLNLGFKRVVTGDGTGVFQAIEEKGIFYSFETIDKILIPDRSFLDLKKYHREFDGLKAASLVTTLGCPFHCYFCSGRETEFYSKLRIRSPLDVRKEILDLNKNFGYEAFVFYNDEMNISTSYLYKLCEKLPKGFHYRGFIKAKGFSDSVAEAMKKAGFSEICCGVESGSSKILRGLGKSTLEENTSARQAAKKVGLRFKAFCMLGFPYETYEDVMLTKKWLIENRPEDFLIQILTPLPGSAIWTKGSPGLKFEKPDFTKKDIFFTTVPEKQQCFTSTPSLSSQDLIKLRQELDDNVRKKLGLRQPYQ